MTWTKDQLNTINDMILARERLAYAKGWVNALLWALHASSVVITKWRDDWQKVVEVLIKDLEVTSLQSGLKPINTDGQSILPVSGEGKGGRESIKVSITPWRVHFPDGTVRPFLTQDYSNTRLRIFVKQFKKMSENPRLTDEERGAWANFYFYVKKELMYREMRL